MAYQIYLVGGAVRDQLLGLPVTEKDYVIVGATPEELINQGFKPVGKDFPVFLHPQTHEEYALARTERKIGKGYHGFSFYAAPEVTLAEDLARRDLTINAMALAEDGQLIDPYQGQRDLQQRLLRHVSAAFAEDPVRVLRLARFAARFKSLGFTISQETLSLAKTLVAAGEMNALVPERVWQETCKALTEKNPAEYFDVLKHCGALAILFPELDHYLAKDSSQVNRAFTALECATQLTTSTEVRFAALTAGLSQEAISALLQRYRISKAFKEMASSVSQAVNFWQQAKTAETILALFECYDALRRPARFANILLACEAATFASPRQREFLLTTLAQLQDALKQIDFSMIPATSSAKVFYAEKKLNCLKAILARS